MPTTARGQNENTNFNNDININYEQCLCQKADNRTTL